MKKGFTLAEVLVTLSIVGVIAILTIPSLVKNYRYKVYSNSIEKAYSQISAAVKQAMDDDMTNDWYKSTSGAVDDNENCTKGSCYFLNNYFKLARKNCGEETTKCFADTYTNLDGSSGNLTFKRGYCVQTVNGMTMCMNIDSVNASTKIALDTNGPSQPNIVGLDTFILQVLPNGEVKDWTDNPDLCNTKASEYGNIADYATGCLLKAMRNNWTITDDK